MSWGSGDLFDSEFIDFSFQDIENSWTNKKPPTIKAWRFLSSGGDFVRRVRSPHIGWDIHSHPKHRGPHCPVAGLLLESLLMSTECYRHRDYPATRILCHRITRWRTPLHFSSLLLAQSSSNARLLPAAQLRGRCYRASAGTYVQARARRGAHLL